MGVTKKINNTMKNNELLSIHEIWKSKKIYWVKTYTTLLKYVSKEYVNIFKPVSVGRKTGKRYFVKEENLNKFIQMFENNKLNK